MKTLDLHFTPHHLDQKRKQNTIEINLNDNSIYEEKLKEIAYLDCDRNLIIVDKNFTEEQIKGAAAKALKEDASPKQNWRGFSWEYICAYILNISSQSIQEIEEWPIGSIPNIDCISFEEIESMIELDNTEFFLGNDVPGKGCIMIASIENVWFEELNEAGSIEIAFKIEDGEEPDDDIIYTKERFLYACAN